MLDIIKSIKDRFISDKFQIDETILNGNYFLAVKNKLISKTLTIFKQLILITFIENPEISDYKLLFEKCLKYAKDNQKIPIPLGLQYGYMIFPCVLTYNVNEKLIEYVTNIPEQHWAILEFPILYDLKNGKIYYFPKTDSWGAFYYSNLRLVITRYIQGICAQ